MSCIKLCPLTTTLWSHLLLQGMNLQTRHLTLSPLVFNICVSLAHLVKSESALYLFFEFSMLDWHESCNAMSNREFLLILKVKMWFIIDLLLFKTSFLECSSSRSFFFKKNFYWVNIFAQLEFYLYNYWWVDKKIRCYAHANPQCLMKSLISLEWQHQESPFPKPYNERNDNALFLNIFLLLLTTPQGLVYILTSLYIYFGLNEFMLSSSFQNILLFWVLCTC